MRLEYLLIYPGAAVVLASVVALMARRRLPDRWARGVVVLGVVLVSARLALEWREPATAAHDLQIFWEGGRDALAGRDPYADVPGEMTPIVNPPTAVPLFEAMAAVPFPWLVPLWKALISLAALGLVPLAFRALAAQSEAFDEPDPPDSPPLRGADVGCLAAAFAASDSATADIALGQLACLTAVALTAAVWAQGRRRPILAGVCLAVATVKVGTMLPVLLLFHRRSDLRTWAALAVSVAALCLLPGHAIELPTRLGEMLSLIREFSGPGQPNDITLQGPQAASIVGFEHAAYRLGLRGHGLPAIAQLVVLGGLGAWLAAVVWRRLVPRAASCSLVMLFALVFLYHRLYDALILALPLAYAVSLACSARGRRRLASALAALAMLSVLYMRRKSLQAASDWSIAHGPAGRMVQAILLPYATWAVVLAIACLYVASRRPAADR
jgi:hypothetical protein